MKEIQIARVYMLESEHHLERILKLLHDEIKVHHVTVFRGIEGFEKGGEIHTSKLLSLSLSLPLVVEFFDTSDKVAKALEPIKKIIGDGHIVTFNAQLR